MTDQGITQSTRRTNYLSRVRGTALLSGERVARVLSLDDGLLDEPSAKGQMLIATNQRILFFREDGNTRETTLLPVEELKGVVLELAPKGTLSPLRGILALIAAVGVYLLIAYWLAGQVQGPQIPSINMDLAPFILLAAVSVMAWFYWRRGVRRPGGKLTLQGPNWSLSVPVSGAERIPEVNEVVECLFAARRERDWRPSSPPEVWPKSG